MSDAQATNRGEVLFVGLSAEELPKELAAQIAERGASVFCCGDVYRALARIGRRAPAAVVASVDWLTAAELEFFEILGRHYPNLPVYVFGAQRAGAKIDRALSFGAASIDAPEDFARVCEGWVAEMNTKIAAEKPTPATGNARKKPDTFAPPGNVFDPEVDRRLREAADAAMASEETAEVDEAEPFEVEAAGETGEQESLERVSPAARVPWQRYEGGPQRVPPSKAPPAETPAAASVSADSNGADDPPLLSPEELKALLGEDDTTDRQA